MLKLKDVKSVRMRPCCTRWVYISNANISAGFIELNACRHAAHDDKQTNEYNDNVESA